MAKLTKLFKSYRFLQLLTGAVYICMALLAMKYTEDTIVESVQIFGVFSLIKGFFELLNRTKIKARTHHNQYSSVFVGCIDLVIGMILIANATLSLRELSVLFGIWFICDAVLSFFMLDLAMSLSKVYYYLSIIADFVGLCIGLILLIMGNSLFISVPSLIGNFFLLFGLMKIIGGVINKDNLHSI
ncbi:DUF308 domain-containing protein [Candidatus Enterococcus ferrettii]|uniref:Acid-resistance membrane protein n=1 Tax=Candidatus Enterococcus ferrettii TaxID=2815324 RepID=A0ABV0ENK0_9ENTE